MQTCMDANDKLIFPHQYSPNFIRRRKDYVFLNDLRNVLFASTNNFFNWIGIPASLLGSFYVFYLQ